METKYLEWEREYKPDTISRMVLGRLLSKYIQGDKEALFGKMNQLVQDEHYRLCVIFQSMFDYLGITKDYLDYISN